MWNPNWSVYENMCALHVRSMWNSFAIQWGFACESLCETPCEVYVKICVKGGDIVSHPFHIYFTMQNFTCMWNMCVKFSEKCVKNVCKECENCFFHMMFHIHTPSSVILFRGISRFLSAAYRRWFPGLVYLEYTSFFFIFKCLLLFKLPVGGKSLFLISSASWIFPRHSQPFQVVCSF